jgi:hypothetical protein
LEKSFTGRFGVADLALIVPSFGLRGSDRRPPLAFLLALGSSTARAVAVSVASTVEII